jgi:hypothetical protein
MHLFILPFFYFESESFQKSGGSRGMRLVMHNSLCLFNRLGDMAIFECLWSVFAVGGT